MADVNYGSGRNSDAFAEQDADAEYTGRSRADSEAPPSVNFNGEDFLFHLYRGSELLQDNCIPEAKEELERALRMQPRDVEGQGLLGVVYFRLGLYPRAIEIYEDLIRACPNEITPRINLALCYLKTAQNGPARDLLESIIQRVPDHLRAWGYLGLVFERLGDYSKAQAAFERAGQRHLARRMENMLERALDVPMDRERPEALEMRRAAADAVRELDTPRSDPPLPFHSAQSTEANVGPRGRWQALEPGEEPMPRSWRPPAPARYPAGASMIEPLEIGLGTFSSPPPSPSTPASPSSVPATDGRIFMHSATSASIKVTESFAVRSDIVRALAPQQATFASETLLRRSRGRDTAEHFGGTQGAWIVLRGSGNIVIATDASRKLSTFTLQGDFIYVRESALVGFDASLRYENGRLPTGGAEPIGMVQLSGGGPVIIESWQPFQSLPVSAERQVTVRAEDILGWTGRLIGNPLETEAAPTKALGFVTFSGDGSVLLDLG
jgi:hypothetical protein